MFIFPLAEVMDKEPSLFELLAVGMAFAAVMFFLCCWRRWSLVFAMPIAILVAIVVTSEVRDPFVGPAIRREAGLGYVIGAYVCGLLPALGCALGCFRARR